MDNAATFEINNSIRIKTLCELVSNVEAMKNGAQPSCFILMRRFAEIRDTLSILNLIHITFRFINIIWLFCCSYHGKHSC